MYPSAVAVDSAWCYCIAAISFPWILAAFKVSAVTGVPAAAVDLTDVDVPGVPAVAMVFNAVAAVPTAVDVPSASGVSTASGIPVVFGVAAVAWRPCYCRRPFCG